MSLLKTTPELFAHEIQNLYATRLNRLHSLPNVAVLARDPCLRSALSAHLDETSQQVDRLRLICRLTGIAPAGEGHSAMEDRIARPVAMPAAHVSTAANDLGIAATAGGVEQDEMHRYETALTLAGELEHCEAARLLRECLWEVHGAARSFRELAQQFLSQWQQSSVAREECGMAGWTGSLPGA
jgi:ferritin-like metal-binding protein YciE